MFQYLKHRLGMDALEKQTQFYHQQWIQMKHRFGEMHDHLLEMKEIIKAHDVLSEKKAMDRHTEVMARLGMVLTALEKSTPHYAVSPMMQTITAASQPKGGGVAISVPRKLKRRTQILRERIMECLPDSHQEPIHYTVMAHKLLCTPGRLGGQLAGLKAQGLVERTGHGLYRKTAQHNQIVENK